MRKILFVLSIVTCLVMNASGQGTWTQKANVGGGARYYTTGFVIGTKGYIGTGYDGGLRKDLWEWDQTTNVWTQKADFGGDARDNAVGFSIGAKGYIGVGGYYNGRQFKKDFWAWDQATNTWTRKADFGGTARLLSVGFSIGSKGYIGTGLTAGGETKDFWEYDSANDTWTQKADFGGPAREGASAFTIGTKGYIGTGAVNDGSWMQDFWEWDQSLNIWTQKANFGGVARYCATGFSLSSKGYVGTGYNVTYQQDFWAWDQVTNTWTKNADFGGGIRSSTTGFAIGNKGYIGLGGSSNVVDKQDFWEFSPSNGCSPSVSISPTNVLCNEGNNGSATANAIGGTMPYTYLWTPYGQTTQTITGLIAGNYSVTVTDANGNSATSTGSITQPSALSVITTVSNASCKGTGGNISTIISGGTLGYQFIWSNGATTQNISELSAGIYTVTVTDANGCSSANNAIIKVIDSIAPIAVCKNITVMLDSSGKAIITATDVDGGSSDACGIASLSIDKSSFNCSNIGNNNVILTVIDKNGNVSTCMAVVKVEDHIAPIITCPSDIRVTAQHNDSAPVVSWNEVTASDNCSASVSSNHHSGDHFPVGTTVVTYTALDPSGNSVSCSFNVIVTADPLAVTIISTNVLCNGSSNGNATAYVEGGYLPYDYSWSTLPIQTGATATGLTAGTYSVKVTDGNGATITNSITITQPFDLSLTTTQTNVLCSEAKGTGTATATGGTSPYTYAWSTSPVQKTATATGLSIGNYSVTVVDANGCSNSATISITQMVLATAQSNILCNGGKGTATVITSGGSAPYTYSWNTSPVQKTATATGLSAANYTVTVTDANGCSKIASVIIIQPAVLALTTTKTNIMCNGGKGTATVIPSGGTIPYTYVWNTIPAQTTKIATGLLAGTYTVKVTDAHGCTISTHLTTTQSAFLAANAGPNKTVYYGYSPNACTTLEGSATGGVAPYKYAWSTGVTTSAITVSPNTGKQYILTVTDVNGCTATDVVKVCVVDVRCDKGCHSSGDKIEVCHKTENGKRETLCVAASAVPAHLAHGDDLGKCGAAISCMDAGKAGEEEENLILGAEIKLTSFPNPFSQETTVRFNTVESGQVEVSVFNMMGIKVATLFNEKAEAAELHEERFSANNLSNGIYFIKLITEQGEMKVERIVLNR